MTSISTFSCPVPACTKSLVLSPSRPTQNDEYVLVLDSPVTKGTIQSPTTQPYGPLSRNSKPLQLLLDFGPSTMLAKLLTISGRETVCGSILVIGTETVL